MNLSFPSKCWTARVGILGLESVAGELERAAVLGNGAHGLLRRAVREGGFDLQRDRDIRTHLPGKVRDDLVGDAARIPAGARGIALHGTVEPAALTVVVGPVVS
jgi:hypothetical protein